MRGVRVALLSVTVLLLAALLGWAIIQRNVWQSWLTPADVVAAPATPSEQHPHPQVPSEQVKLSPQAQANLRLTSKPLRVQTFWKRIQLPGEIVDRPGLSDRGVIAPLTGVITKIHQIPGDTVRPQDPLFTIRPLSEQMQTAQTELFKASREIQITSETRQRLSKLGTEGAIPVARLIEIDNQLRRLAVTEQAYRMELQLRGLTPEQIEKVAQGTFVTETFVLAPQRRQEERSSGNNANESVPKQDLALYEMQELKVGLGQQVQAGETLCLLSHHESLDIEGHGFRREIPLLEQAIQNNWPVEVEFMEEQAGPEASKTGTTSSWPAFSQQFTIRHISNTIDPVSRTFAFYIPLTNPFRTYEKDGRTRLLWRYRPGQRVRIHIRTEQLDNVFVVPAEAVVREGPEAFVFRQNGDFFDRKAVHLLYADRQHAVIANNGSVPPGVSIAQNGATQLNRVLKAQRTSGQPNVHVHADGTVHANH